MVVFKLFLIFFLNIFIFDVFSLETNIRVFKKHPVNIRKGPGKSKDRVYPVVAIAGKSDIPFIVIDVFEDWSNIKLIDSKNNLEGWVKTNVISNRKNLTCLKTDSFIFRFANYKDKITFLEKGRVVNLLDCYKNHCKVFDQVTKKTGWIYKSLLWII